MTHKRQKATKVKCKRDESITKQSIFMEYNNNNNLFIYGALFNILGDQKGITTINNLKTKQILEIYKYI